MSRASGWRGLRGALAALAVVTAINDAAVAQCGVEATPGLSADGIAVRKNRDGTVTLDASISWDQRQPFSVSIRVEQLRGGAVIAEPISTVLRIEPRNPSACFAKCLEACPVGCSFESFDEYSGELVVHYGTCHWSGCCFPRGLGNFCSCRVIGHHLVYRLAVPNRGDQFRLVVDGGHGSDDGDPTDNVFVATYAGSR